MLRILAILPVFALAACESLQLEAQFPIPQAGIIAYVGVRAAPSLSIPHADAPADFKEVR